ncbi:hypothetical protein TCON_0747 [Astathelohania contejeani]|uniref:Uncharacterized protein n=1 Tax=Astathelohania contejeani TaxID=164912 RepID=A0ABQ7I0V9_9MICR|nr:hypothetical protein TCON_0747 [Thelohania contejeani]
MRKNKYNQQINAGVIPEYKGISTKYDHSATKNKKLESYNSFESVTPDPNFTPRIITEFLKSNFIHLREYNKKYYLFMPSDMRELVKLMEEIVSDARQTYLYKDLNSLKRDENICSYLMRALIVTIPLVVFGIMLCI